MLNSHAKSHTNVYQYRCADCTYASKYCHSLKLHLRKHAHQPATVLNSDGTLPTDESGDFDRLARRGPPRGSRTAPPPLMSGRKSSFDDVTISKRALSAEAQIVPSVTPDESSKPLPANRCWPPREFPVAAAGTLPSRDPYAFTTDEDADCPTERRVDAKRRSTPPNSSANSSDRGSKLSTENDINLPDRKRLRNAEFIARLTANIEAELDADDRPLDLTAKLVTSQTWKSSEDTDMAQRNGDTVAVSETSATAVVEDDGSVTSSSTSGDTSRGARRRKGTAQRRVDAVVNGCEEISTPPWSPSVTQGPRTAATHPMSPHRDSRGFVECRHCRIGFRDRLTYSLHMGYHGYDEPFACNMCGHQTSDRVEFFVHIATAAH